MKRQWAWTLLCNAGSRDELRQLLLHVDDTTFDQIKRLRQALLYIIRQILQNQQMNLLMMFQTWKQRVSILSIHMKQQHDKIMLQQYLLRKYILKRHWRLITQGWNKWIRLCRYYYRLQKTINHIQCKQLIRLGWKQWKHHIHTERLEEELLAYRCVIWTRQLDHRLKDMQQKRERSFIIDYWIQWKRWSRKQACTKWSRQRILIIRRYFNTWRQHHHAIKTQSSSHTEKIRGMVQEIIFSHVFEVIGIDEKLRNAACTWIKFFTLLDCISTRQVRKSLQRVFRRWQENCKPMQQHINVNDSVQAKIYLQTFPQRVAASYKAANRRRLPLYQPSWR